MIIHRIYGKKIILLPMKKSINKPIIPIISPSDLHLYLSINKKTKKCKINNYFLNMLWINILDETQK